MTKAKTKPTSPPRIKDVRLCTEADGYEAIYVDGKLKDEQDTFYMCEVAGVVGKGPVKIQHHSVELEFDKWPKRFEKLKLVD